MTKLRTWALSITMLALAAAPGRAETVSIQVNYDSFGHLHNQGGECAPTSTVNGMQYLQSEYPAVYGTLLLPGGDIAGVRDQLFTSSYMTTAPNAQTMWEGKVRWMEQHAPGATRYAGMALALDPQLWLHGSDVQYGLPTWDFLWSQLSAQRDVELAIDNFSLGHAVSLTSMSFDDQNHDGLWQTTEPAQIGYLDPNNPTTTFQAGIFVDEGDGSLNFHWNNGGANTPQDVWIEEAYASGPVPEPAAWLLGAQALLAGLFYAWRRRR